MDRRHRTRKVIILVAAAFALLACCGLFLSACSDLDAQDTSTSAAANDPAPVSTATGVAKPAGVTPVYVTLFSHNEDNWDSIVGTVPKYMEYRENLLAKLQLIAQYGAKLDWQSDISVLNAMVKNEKGDLLTTTGGKTIVRYMAEDLGFSVDPHGHLNQCNYADLAYLIEQLGGPTPQVIGGLRLYEFGGDYLGFMSVNNWRKDLEIGADGVIHGRVYPEARWTPSIVTVPAMGAHWFDEWSSGVWRPAAGTDFVTDDPSGSIACIGQGYPHTQVNLGGSQEGGSKVKQECTEYIEELVGKIESGELPAGEIYTASIHIRDLPVVNARSDKPVDTLEALRQTLELLAPLERAGKIVFATYPEVLDIWQSRYGSTANRVPLDDFSMYDALLRQAMQKAESNTP